MDFLASMPELVIPIDLIHIRMLCPRL